MSNESPKFILFVDDETQLHFIVETALKTFCDENGLKLECFPSGVECLEFVEKNNSSSSILGIITDLNMPKMDGFTLIKRLKEDYNDLNIAISSAYGDEETVEKANELGVTNFLFKPISIKGLIDTIRNFS